MSNILLQDKNSVDREQKISGGYECFHCGCDSVIWDSDFDFEDYGIDGAGIIHECHCTNCGARIIYEIPCDDRLDDIPDGSINVTA